MNKNINISTIIIMLAILLSIIILRNRPQIEQGKLYCEDTRQMSSNMLYCTQ
jgi:hypothetical protein